MIDRERIRTFTLPCFALLAVLLTFITGGIPVKSAYAASSSEHSAITVWGSKPVLSYFILNPDLAGRIKQELGLTATQFNAIRTVAIAESEHLQTLFQASEDIVQDARLSFAAKHNQIQRLRYNDQVLATLQNSDAQLRTALDPQLYTAFVKWIERQWQAERAAHGMAKAASTSTGRAYTIFATQYKAHSAYEVAIPDKCIKFANLGWSLAGCRVDAYTKGANYTVGIERQGYTVDHAPVLDVGPWNIDDTYWLAKDAPQYRRHFASLPTGISAAQAAFFDNYNDGKDQFGRKVLNPAGIDLSDGVRQALGLRYLENAWVQVTFSWTHGVNGPIYLPLVAQEPSP